MCDAAAESFDVVFALEVLENVFNWKTVISNMKRLCKRNALDCFRRAQRDTHFVQVPTISGGTNLPTRRASSLTVK